MEEQHSLLIRYSIANQAQLHLSWRLPILTFHKHWSHEVIVQRQGCDRSQCCCFIFYPHETKHHLHLPLWCTSVNPRVLWSHKQITPSRGLVTLVRLSFSPPHSCCVFGGGQTGIWLTQSVFYLLEWSGLDVGIESGNPDLSLHAAPNCGWYPVRFRVARSGWEVPQG